MHLQHFGLKHEPLGKQQSEIVDSKQHQSLCQYLGWLTQTNGVGLVTGEAGVGKTTVIHQWAKSLNPLTHRVIYQADNHFKAFDIYCQLAESLGLDSHHRYSRLWRGIKEEVLHLADEKKLTPVWILDESQNLPLSFFADLPAFLNFSFDTRDIMIILLVGTPKLQTIVQRCAYSALSSRIQFHFEWQALDDFEKFSQIIETAFKQAGCQQALLSQTAMKLIHMASKGRLRYAHRLITRSLQLAAKQNLNHLPDDIISNSIEMLRSTTH